MVFTPAQKLSGSIVWTPIRYVTLQFRDRRGAASLHYRNRAEITVLYMCEQKPYPVVYHEHLNVLCRNHRSCVWTETLSGMVFVLVQKLSSRTLIVGFQASRERASERRKLSFFRVPLKRDFSRVFQIRRACLQAGDMYQRYLQFCVFVCLMSYTAKIKSFFFGEPARRSQTK